MKVRTALAAGSLATAGSLVGLAGPADADLVTHCLGEGGEVVVPNDLVVPAEETCWLTGTTVQGDVTVEAGADLVVVDGTLEGEVEVQGNGYLDTTETSINGEVTADEAYGAYLGSSTLGAGVSTDMADDGFVYSYESSVADAVDAAGGELLFVGSQVGADVTGEGTLYTDVFDSTILGGLTVADNELGGIFCESEVDGDASYTGNSDVLQIGADGPLSPCAGASYFGGSLDVSDNTAMIEVSHTIIRGDLSGEGNDPAPTGENNRVRGTASGQFEDLPEPADARTLDRPDRVDKLDNLVDNRRSAAKERANALGQANL